MTKKIKTIGDLIDAKLGIDTKPIAVAVELDDQHREQMKWLTVAMSLADKHCIYCNKTWESREDCIARPPIVAGKSEIDGMQYACKACYKINHPEWVPNIY